MRRVAVAAALILSANIAGVDEARADTSPPPAASAPSFVAVELHRHAVVERWDRVEPDGTFVGSACAPSRKPRPCQRTEDKRDRLTPDELATLVRLVEAQPLPEEKPPGPPGPPQIDVRMDPCDDVLAVERKQGSWSQTLPCGGTIGGDPMATLRAARLVAHVQSIHQRVYEPAARTLHGEVTVEPPTFSHEGGPLVVVDEGAPATRIRVRNEPFRSLLLQLVGRRAFLSGKVQRGGLGGDEQPTLRHDLVVERVIAATAGDGALHRAPDDKSPIVARFDRGRLLSVYDEQGGWLKIALDEKHAGWVHAADVTLAR